MELGGQQSEQQLGLFPPSLARLLAQGHGHKRHQVNDRFNDRLNRKVNRTFSRFIQSFRVVSRLSLKW